MLTDGAIMLALAIVLSLVTPFQKLLPFGGSITLVSMLPICIYSIKYGIGNGFALSFLFALFQLGHGIIKDGIFGWGLDPIMLVGCIMFDYIIAYTVLGISGVFRRKGMTGWLCGTALALFLRFVSHFLSGVVIFASTGRIWEELDFVAENSIVYSLVYNGAYMLPEIVLTVIAAFILFSIPQTRKLIMPVKDRVAAA